MTIDANWLSPACAIVATLFAVLNYTRGGGRNHLEDDRDIRGQLERVSARVTRAETLLEVLLKDVAVVAASSLHREDDRHGLDQLLEGYAERALTREEILELQRRLKEVARSGDPKEKMLAWVLLRNMQARYGEGDA